MLCENELCVYEENGACTLDSIGIDFLGMCDQCIIPNFDQNTLKSAKQKTLKNMEK